ncbi:MAG: acyl-CoA dehydratase activase [Candidatus Thermoplasmatota archaeon]
MITCGVDVGAGSTKAVLLEDGKRLLATTWLPTKGQTSVAAKTAIETLTRDANLLPDEIASICSTGFGRYSVEERNLQVSDITSSARGAVFLHPAARHVLDIGTQSSRAIAINERGRVLKFKMNEKCAAGAGRFVERCSKYLQVPPEDMGARACLATNPRTISSVCAVLAETEIINYIAEEVPVQDILMGIFMSLAERGHALMKNVGIQPDVVLVGGLVQSAGMVEALRRTTGLEVHVDPRMHHAAAIGAAMLAHMRLEKTRGGTPSMPASGRGMA